MKSLLMKRMHPKQIVQETMYNLQVSNLETAGQHPPAYCAYHSTYQQKVNSNS